MARLNPSHFGTFARVLALLLVVALGIIPVSSAAGTPYQAVTSVDPKIPLEELALLLTPLTMDELETEAEAWVDLVKAKAHEISSVEIAAKHKNKELAAAKESLNAAEKAQKKAEAEKASEPAEGASAQSEEQAQASEAAKKTADATAEAKAGLLKDVNVLRDQRTALIDRANRVLDEFEKKGGDPATHRTYLTAVSGIRLDVSDTSATWATLTGWLQSEEGGMRYARNLGIFLITVIVFWFLSLVVGRVAYRVMGAARNVTVLMQEFAAKFVRRFIFVVGVIIGLSALEVNIGPLLAVIGAAGFVVAFALQDTLGSFASGIMILVYRPFDVGDVVDVAGVTGKVASLNLVSVTIRTPDNKVVVVPNNSVWGNVITNATGSAERRVDMVFGVGYGDDLQKAQAVLERVIAEHPLVLPEPAPVIRVHELADSSVNFVCRPWVKTKDYWDVYWDITRTVKEQFDAAGVSIPFPQRDVHLFHGDGATPRDIDAAGQA